MWHHLAGASSKVCFASLPPHAFLCLHTVALTACLQVGRALTARLLVCTPMMVAGVTARRVFLLKCSFESPCFAFWAFLVTPQHMVTHTSSLMATLRVETFSSSARRCSILEAPQRAVSTGMMLLPLGGLCLLEVLIMVGRSPSTAGWSPVTHTGSTMTGAGPSQAVFVRYASSSASGGGREQARKAAAQDSVTVEEEAFGGITDKCVCLSYASRVLLRGGSLTLVFPSW